MPVPGPRPAPVQLGGENVDVGRETRIRLGVREEEAALTLELLVEERLDLRDGHARAREHLSETPAGHGAWHERSRVGVDERGTDVVEVEGGVNPAADAAQNLVGRRLPGDPRRHVEELFERALVAADVARLVGLFDGKSGVVGERDEQVELVVARDAARDGLVDGERAEEIPGGVSHRDEERIERIPRIGVRRALARRCVDRAERVPVDGAFRHVVRPAPLEARVEQHDEMRALTLVAEQRQAGVVVPVDRDDLEVVPRGPVEMHRDRAEAERLADRPGNRVEQRREIFTRPQAAGHLKKASQR